MENIIEKAKNYAISCHRNTNHLYDGKPYEVHLNDEKNRKLPKIHKHELSLMCEGIGSNNPKEYCKCVDCKKLRERRNLIYNKPIHKIKRWFNNNF